MQALARSWEAFWLERSIEPGRLAALRVGFFGLLGADLVHLMVAKAYRYGAAGFNVPHFDSWGALLPMPSAAVHTVFYLLAGFLAFRVAAGIAVRVSLVWLTLIYGYAYFASLLDSYQHHYMVFWFLLLSWFVPFHRVRGVEFHEAPAARIPAWGLSLFYAQMSLVYFFTAVTKLDAHWRDGWVLQTLPLPVWINSFAADAGAALHYSTDQVFSLFAYTVLIWEFIAAAAFVFPRLRVFCCITGPIFHVMVELINLKVRWFSLYMLVLYYLLLFPDAWYGQTTRVLARISGIAQVGWSSLTRPRKLRPVARVALVSVGCGAIFGLCATSVLPGGLWLAGGICFFVLWAEVRAESGSFTLPRILVQFVIVALVVGIPRFSNTGYEYYRLKGGDLTLRGELAAAVPAYEHAVALNPGPGSRHAKLADVLYRLGRYDEAMPLFREALELDPEQTRALRGIAKALQREGRHQEARSYLETLRRLQRPHRSGRKGAR